MDPFWIAVVSASSAVVGAFVGALPNLLQSRAQRDERDKERVRQEETQRYESAIAFVDEMGNFTMAEYWKDTVDLHRTASRLISQLRTGEAPVADFVRASVQQIQDAKDARSRLEVANVVADDLFKYLRGDITARHIGGF